MLNSSCFIGCSAVVVVVDDDIRLLSLLGLVV